MKQSKDPFEAAFEEQEESPPDSPIAPDNTETHTPAALHIANGQEDDDSNTPKQSTSTIVSALEVTVSRPAGKAKEEDEEEEEDNMDGELEKFPASGDRDKM